MGWLPGRSATSPARAPPTPSRSRDWRALGFVADVLGCSITVGDIYRTKGRLDHALRTYQEALDLAGRMRRAAEPLRGTADMHVGIAGVLLERGDLAGAAEQLAVCERLGEYNGLPQNPYRSRVVAARLRQAEGDLDAALELLDEADRVYNGDYSPNVQPVPAMRARLRIRRGELRRREEWAREPGSPPMTSCRICGSTSTSPSPGCCSPA